MAGIDLTIAQARLDAYLAAEVKVLAGQKIVIDGTEFTRANLSDLQKGIDIWNGRVQRLTPAASGGARRVRQVIPL
jgi:hypothetical protein